MRNEGEIEQVNGKISSNTCSAKCYSGRFKGNLKTKEAIEIAEKERAT